MTARRPRVAIIWKYLPQWRRHFYEMLHDRLDEIDINLSLIYGQATGTEAHKPDRVDIVWAHKIRNRIVSVAGQELNWQPCLGLLREVDLVIVEQASSLLINYILLAQSMFGIRRTAFWGHGRNFQLHTASRIGEAVKRFTSRRAHWWFAYNTTSAEVVKALGFPPDRISNVQNAIDTRQLSAFRSKVTLERLEALRSELGLCSNNVAVFCGSMYADKRLGFLLEACNLIREKIPDFELIMIGGGPDEAIAYEAARQSGWIHYVGPKFNEERVPYYMLSKLSLMPGLVGLTVLDSFALEVPLITTNVPFHSPEIEYLKNEINGVIVEPSDDVEFYAATVAELLRDSARRQTLVDGCKRSGRDYTLEEMVERFAQGIAMALQRPV